MQELKLYNFYNIGISYKKADAKMRGRFSLSIDNQASLLKYAKEKNVKGIFVLSTCNRTEISGFAKSSSQLIELLCEFSEGTTQEFSSISNIYTNQHAIDHLFRIGTGLESQILGDYEIVGQLKQAFKLAKSLKVTNAYLERLLNSVLQASKHVKNETKLSSGATSVSYAAVQYIINNLPNYNSKNILVFGLGKIGNHTCKNLAEYLENKSICLINRTEQKTIDFIKENPFIKKALINDLSEEIEKADVLIVSTSAKKPTITQKHVSKNKKILILDLSIPHNVAKDVADFENVSLVDVDKLSKVTDETLAVRQQEIPFAEAIIETHKAEFNQWVNDREFTPAINALKASLENIRNEEIDFQKKKIADFNENQAEIVTSHLIQKITTQFVKHLKNKNTSVSESIQMISDIFQFDKKLLMQRTIKIGTRNSKLAIWQANKVREKLARIGYESILVPIKSTGDIILDKPLYEFGITGVFTKNLDAAILNGDIDIAVHSLKDVPTSLPNGIVQAAVLERGNYIDLLVLKDTEEFLDQQNGVVATGSLRRKAQWLNKYPTHKVEGLRGNINTRLEKLKNSKDWNGAIFAAAGLERLDKDVNAIPLDWMIPAPAQGAIMVAALENDKFILNACQQLNHYKTEICINIEREFLKLLEAGCTSPIGALACIDEETQEIEFKGVLLKKDGSEKITVNKTAKLGSHKHLARNCAEYIINKGGKKLMLENNKLEYSTIKICSTKKLSELQKRKLTDKITILDSNFINIELNKIAIKHAKNEHVVITSQNAVMGILNSFTKNELSFKNIYCVGEKTKELIEDKISTVSYIAKNAKALADYLHEKLANKEITYFCGNIRLDILPNLLQENGILVNEVETYKTTFNSIKIEDDISGVLFYSPSGVRSYLTKNTTNRIAFCIGETTAKEAKKHFNKVKIANLPSIDSMLELINNYYK